MSANDTQVGGDHYKQHGATGEQLWDRIARLDLDFFQGTTLRYVERWRDKGGVEDLMKAIHYLTKYIELIEAGVIPLPVKDAPETMKSSILEGFDPTPYQG